MGLVNLRALTRNDLDKTLKWHNQEDIRELYSGHPFPINKEMAAHRPSGAFTISCRN